MKEAKNIGKNVFCIPGSLENAKSVGTNNLIKEGSFIATDVKDIIAKYKWLKKIRKIKNIKIEKENIERENVREESTNQEDEAIDEKYRKIYELIPKEGININEIVIKNNLNLSDVMEKITILEIMGKIKRKAGNKYFKI